MATSANDTSSFVPGSSDEDERMQPSGQRWDPLGAAKNDDDEDDQDGTALAQYDTDSSNRTHHHQLQRDPDPGRIKSLEDEQEMLSSSLFALTSHFAQVQFRLRQIVDSPAEQRDQLLHSLEEFAFRGIPDEVVSAGGGGSSLGTTTQMDHRTTTDSCSPATGADGGGGGGGAGSHEPLFEAMELQRNRQIELIEQLKRQLTDVERFAYESGSKILPQSMLVEKQRVIIDELCDKLNLNVCDADLPQLSSEQLRSQVDTALVELVGPVKMKDTLVGQLKTQIVDLERFVAHLQCETYDLKLMTKSIGGGGGGVDKGGGGSSESAYGTYNSKMAKTRRQSRMGSASSMGGDGVEPSGPKDLRPATAEAPTAANRSGNGAAAAGGGDGAAGGRAGGRQSVQESLSDKAAGVLEKASNLLSIFAVTQLGCGASQHHQQQQQQQQHHFQKNTLKRTAKGNHWGDLRAQLEIDVQEICSLVASVAAARSRLAAREQRNRPRAAAQQESSDEDEEEEEEARGHDDDDDSSTPSETPIAQRYSSETLASIQLEITTMVRKHFAITLQRLIEHGLRENGGMAGLGAGSSTSLAVPFMGCFARRTRAAMQRRRSYAGGDEYHQQDGGAYDDGAYDSRRQMHAWELCLEYYHIKNGEEFNETPARMLSQSFNLDITDGSSTITSAKQGLLGAIGTIIQMHSPYKRSANSHFKALVSMGLNSQKLPQWLNLMFQCRELVQQHYADWSYVRHTGFRDGLRCLDRLSCYHFDLPVDLAIRQFQNIKDVF